MSALPKTCSSWARALFAVLFGFATVVSAEGEFRVCADPDNLPFSNRKQEGFENKIAEILAADMDLKPVYVWSRQRGGFIRYTLGEHLCDVVIGVPYGYERVLTTKPYYRSAYFFVTKRSRQLEIATFRDPRLRHLKIGVQAIGDDGANSPPSTSLARRGIVGNITGYSMWAAMADKNPEGKIVDAVAAGDIDTAIVWGPIAGYFARQHAEDLVVTPVPADEKIPAMPFEFEIAMGVRKEDGALADKLQKSLERRHAEIRAILTSYNIPLNQHSAGVSASAHESLNRAVPKS